MSKSKSAPPSTGSEVSDYLKSNGWKEIFSENGESLSWWHPEIPALKCKYYPLWAAQAFQSGLDDFLYLHLNRK